MRALSSLCAVACLGVALGALAQWPPARGQSNLVQDGTAAFVVSEIEYAIGDAAEAGACPGGTTEGYANILDAWVNRPSFDRPENELTEADLAPHFRRLLSDPQNYCQHPELGVADARFRTVSGSNAAAMGIDLDGQVSRAGSAAAAGTCAHEDFSGANGQRGIDNQFYRVVGCTTSFSSSGQSNDLMQEQMLTGQWGILISLSDVDDLRNDNDVGVHFRVLAEPLSLSPSREVLPFSTYAVDADPRFQAATRGRIRNGVLTTDPVDVRFYSVFDADLRLERPLREARIDARLGEGGVLDGILAGYTPVEDMWNVHFGFRDALRNGASEAAPLTLRNSKSVGQAYTIGGYTCEGAYHALLANADGHRDAQTGRCTSISTQYRFRAVPAFMIQEDGGPS